MIRYAGDDWDDDAAQRAAAEQEAAWLAQRSRDYRRELRELPDGSWYWDLYRGDERVNGGLSATRHAALSDAWQATSRHVYTRAARPVPPMTTAYRT